MDTAKKLGEAKAFARANLVTLAAEIIEWHDTGVLCNGLMRELGNLCRPLDEDGNMRIAESLVSRAAFDALSTPAAADAPEPVSAALRGLIVAIDAAGYSTEFQGNLARAERALASAPEPVAGGGGITVKSWSALPDVPEPVAVVDFGAVGWRRLVDALVSLPDGTKLYTASPAPSESAAKDAEVAEFQRLTRELCAETLRNPGKPVPIPAAIRQEWIKMIRDEPSIFDRFTHGELRRLGDDLDAAMAASGGESAT